MNQLLATFIKELTVLIRDKTGLVILFAMPLFLVVIITLIQNEAYKGFSASGLPVLLINYDNDRLGEEVEKGFTDLPVFNVTIEGEDTYPDISSIKNDVLQGEYLAALVIPKDATNALRDNVEEMISLLMQDSSLQNEDEVAKVDFKIIIDPITRKSVVIAINSSLKEYVASIKTKLLSPQFKFQSLFDKCVKGRIFFHFSSNFSGRKISLLPAINTTLHPFSRNALNSNKTL